MTRVSSRTCDVNSVGPIISADHNTVGQKRNFLDDDGVSIRVFNAHSLHATQIGLMLSF